MAGRIARSTGRFALIFILFLAITLTCSRLTLREPTGPAPQAQAEPTSPTHLESNSPPSHSTNRNLRAEGRWKLVRASIGLPPVSDLIHIKPQNPLALPLDSRFDLRRKRSIEEQELRTVPLYFAPDALEPRSVMSLEDFFGPSRGVSSGARARAPRQGEDIQNQPAVVMSYE
jgi:hypothetical protein